MIVPVLACAWLPVSEHLLVPVPVPVLVPVPAPAPVLLLVLMCD